MHAVHSGFAREFEGIFDSRQRFGRWQGMIDPFAARIGQRQQVSREQVALNENAILRRLLRYEDSPSFPRDSGEPGGLLTSN